MRFDDEGKPEFQDNFVNNQPHGTWYEFHHTGEIYEETPYNKG